MKCDINEGPDLAHRDRIGFAENEMQLIVLPNPEE